MSNSAKDTDYPCRKATCCGEDDPFPNFTQGLLPYRMRETKQCVDYYTPPLPPPLVIPEFNGDCMAYTAECIKELLNDEDECGFEWTSPAYVCAVQKALEQCGGPPAVDQCNDEQTCCVTCPDGTINCYTLDAGVICASSKALANAQAYSIACQRAEDYKMCAQGCPTCCCVGDAYSFTFTITGGLATKTFEVIDGALPPGLSLTGATIAGVPTLAGNWTFTVRIDDGRMQALKTCTMYALEISTASLNDYTVGVPFSQQLQVTGGSGSYAWKILSGTLPAGLTMSITGLISGTPTGATTETLVFDVIDNACEVADRTFIPPRILMTGRSTTTIATVRGFSPYIQTSTPPKKYKKVAWTGTSEQWAYTWGGERCSGAKYVWSGISEIDLYGHYVTKHRKDYYCQCPTATTLPDISSTPSFGLYKLEGYCYPSDPNSCSTCPPSPYLFKEDRSSGTPSDSTTFLNDPTGPVHTINPLSISNVSGTTQVVAVTGSGLPMFSLPGGFAAWVIIHASHNYSATISDEYTDADALSVAQVYTGNGLTAENRPRTTGYTSRWTISQYRLSCSNLVVGQDYTARVRFWLDTGSSVYQSHSFVATATTHVITANVPTPLPGHTIEARDAEITFA